MADFPIDVVIKSEKAQSGGKKAETAIDGVDRATQRTLKTLERLNSTLNKVNSTLSKSSGTKKLNDDLAKAKKQIKDANDRLKELEGSTKKADTQLFSLSKTVKLVTSGFVALKLTQQAKEAALLSQRYNELGISLTTVGRNTGQTRQFLDNTVKSLEGLGISMIEARQTVLRLASAQIDLSKAEQLADLARNAAIVGQINTSEALNRITFGVSNASLVTLRSVGIVTQFDNAYKQLAEELGKTTDDLTLAEKQQARLNAVLAQAPALTGLYEEAMNNAGKQFRSTDRLVENLKIQIGGVFDNTALLAVGAYTDKLKELTVATKELTDSGDFERYGNNIARIFAVAGDVVGNFFNIIARGNDLVRVTIRQIGALSRGDLAGAQALGAGFVERVQQNIKDVTSLNDKLDEQITIRENLAEAEKTAESGAFGLSDITQFQTDATNRLIEAEKKLVPAVIASGQALEGQAKARADFVGKLSDEREAIGKSSVELRKMQAERLGLGDSMNKLIDEIEASTLAFERQQQILSDVERTTEQFKSSEQRLNEELERLNVLLQNGLGWQEYQAAVASAKEEILGVDETLDKVEKTSRSIFGDMSQFAIQGARNIQSAFADFLFEPFKDGLDGMFKNFARILKRMVAELAASGILNGVASLFNGGTFGSGVSNTFGGFGNLGSLFSAGGGLGSRSGRFTNTGGAGTAFIGGPNTALGGTGTNGASTAVSSLISGGRTFFAGLSGAAIGTGIGSSIAGDKEVFGKNGTVTSAITSGLGIAVGGFFGGAQGAALGGSIGGTIGGIITSVFGRGPLKKQETRLLGDVSLDSGFEGALNTRFRAKGGLLRGSKTDNVLLSGETGELLSAFEGIVESGISKELKGFAESAKDTALTIDNLLDKSIQQMGRDLKNTAVILGLNSDALDTFNTKIDIAGEKGEPISAEQINQAISDVGDHMANVLLPGLQDLRNEGETAVQALSRITSQFIALEDALIIFGVSADDAEKAVSGLSIETRNELVEAAGGFEALNDQVNFFASNFLTSEEQLDIATQGLNRQLTDLGVATNISVENFKQLILSVTQTGGASTDLATKLLALAPAFKNVRDAEESLGRSSDSAASATDKLALSINSLSDAATFAAISGLGEEVKESLIAAAGGLDAFISKARFFVNNFVSSEQQLTLSTGALESELSRLGLSTDLTVDEFRDLVIESINAGNAGAQLTNTLLNLAPAFFAVRGSADGLISRFNAVAASERRITEAREAAVEAQNQLAVESARGVLAAAQKELSNAQNELSTANTILSEAKSNLSSAQQELARAQAAAVQNVIDERSALIESYRSEADALRSVTGRFDNLASKLIGFRDSLATSDLSPLTPGQQLAVTKQRFESTLAAAQAGDADALDRLPQVSQEFLQASKQFNGATDNFKFDFERVQAAADFAVSVAVTERDIAQASLDGIEAQIRELEELNEATRANGERLLSIEEATRLVEIAQGEVAAATSNVADINARIEAAQANVESATLGVEEATRELNGGLDAIEQATKRVGDTMFELGNAILQGFGNAAISDQQIRDFLAANPTLSVQQIIDIAIAAGVSGSQFARATGTPIQDVNFATGGRTVPGSSISDFVNANLGNPFRIIEAARENGITRERLAEDSILTLGEIDAFVRDNNIAGFMEGTDRTPRAGLAFIHENESIGPSTMPAEIKVLQAQMERLIEIVEIQTEELALATDDAANKVVIGNITATEDLNFKERSAATLR